MTDLTIWTLDWVPNGPRGFVRDLRLRWACEEAGLPYVVRTIPFADRETNHLDRQPFGQVPFLDDGSIRMCESGAALLHLARKTKVLMPTDPAGEAETTQWLFSALNSIEMVSVPWWLLGLMGQAENPLDDWLEKRLAQMEAVLQTRDWLAAGRFTVADLAMADVLRVRAVRAFGSRPATEAYVARITARPAFVKAYADQMTHWQAADERRAEQGAR